MTIVDLPRKQAKELGLFRYTGASCKYGHVIRLVSNKQCIECRRISNKNRRLSSESRHAYHLRHVKDRRKRSKSYPIIQSLRRRIRNALSSNARAGSAVRDLGCTIPQFRDHISAKFQDGMSWDNYGKWHLDHIRPLAAFDLTNRDQFLAACHFSNYQPLWAADNLAKGAQSI